jgi:predicted dehydrogenase
MYLAEMKAFLGAARRESAADAAGPDDGSAALRVVEAAKRSARAGVTQVLR